MKILKLYVKVKEQREYDSLRKLWLNLRISKSNDFISCFRMISHLMENLIQILLFEWSFYEMSIVQSLLKFSHFKQISILKHEIAILDANKIFCFFPKFEEISSFCRLMATMYHALKWFSSWFIVYR